MLFSDSQIDSVYTEKIVDAQTRSMPVMTRRDVWLPQVQGKAHVLAALDGSTLAQHACWFGGGTCIALVLVNTVSRLRQK